MALANSLRRIWSAKGRVSPIEPGAGTRGSMKTHTKQTGLFGPFHESILALHQLAHKTAPTVLVIVWSIFR